MTPLPSPIARAAAAPPIIGRGITSALIGSSVLLGLLLIPDRDELQERFARDGNHHRALQLASDQEAQALAEKLRLAQEAAETVVVETPGQIVANTFANPARLATLNADPVARKNFVLALLATQDVEHDFELLKTHSAALSPEARDAILRGLGDSALSQSHPELAARVYSEFLKAHPDTDPSLVTEMVKSWRYSGQPAQALAFLENWLTARKKAGGAIPEELYLTQITLLREMNRPGQAFDALLLQLAREKARPAGISVETMKLSVQTAGFVDRTSELRPILAEWVNRMPLAQAPWDKVRDAKAGSALLENKGAFLTYGHMLAQWHEWGDEADAAYDLYLKLAVLGEPGAIERCEALYPGLFREEEYLNLLLAVVPVAGAETYTLQLAQNLAGAARYDEAEKWFHTWLTAHPDDGHTFAELGGMREEQAELEAALAAYQRALELLPQDLDIRKKTATVCIDLEKHEAALEGLNFPVLVIHQIK